MRKIYKNLTQEQKQRGVIFTSTLSTETTEQHDDKTHEVFNTDEDRHEKIERLKDDDFFNPSHWNYNIIRQ